MKKVVVLLCVCFVTYAAGIQGTWQSFNKPSVNDHRLAHGTVYDSDNDMIYMIGGTPNGYASSIVDYIYSYNPNTNTWNTSLNSMATGRAWIQGAYWNGKIYVVAGLTRYSTITNSCEVYDIASNTWSSFSSIPQSRLGHGSVAHNGNIYIIGGSDGASTGYTTVYRYNISGNSWTQATSLPTAWETGGCAIYNDVIYLCGGYDRNNTVAWDHVYSGTISTGNPDNITWTQRAALPAPMGQSAAAAMNGYLFVLGGFDETKVAKAWFFAYVITTMQIIVLLDYPIPITRNHFSVARNTRTFDGLYGVAGDANGDYNTPNNYYYYIKDPIGIAEGVSSSVKERILSVCPSIGNKDFTISFALSSPGSVSLTVHSILGQKVMTLYDGNRSEGDHSFKLSAKTLPAGVYVVKLNTDNTASTQKFVITE